MVRNRHGKYPCPSGLGMSNLKGNKNRFLRKTFHHLTNTNQSKVKELAERHYNACNKFGWPFDPEFMLETITDLRDNKFQDD